MAAYSAEKMVGLKVDPTAEQMVVSWVAEMVATMAVLMAWSWAVSMAERMGADWVDGMVVKLEGGMADLSAASVAVYSAGK